MTNVNTVVTARRLRRELRSRRHTPSRATHKNAIGNAVLMVLEKKTCPYNLIASLTEINEGINTSVTWGFKPMDHMIH